MTTHSEYIEVAVDFPNDRTYTYAVPASLAASVSIGKRVLAPFGPRRLTGYILGKTERPGGYAVKSILDILDDHPLFPENMIPFFKWIAAYYFHPLGEVIQNALPGGLNLSDHVSLALTPGGEKALSDQPLNPLERHLLSELRHGPDLLKKIRKKMDQPIPAAVIRRLENQGWMEKRQRLTGGKTKIKTRRCAVLKQNPDTAFRLTEARKKILSLLKDPEPRPIQELKSFVPTADAIIRKMAAGGFVEIIEQPLYRNPLGEAVSSDAPPVLNDEQQTVIETVLGSLNGGYAAYLLAGVTGSGKTEVYLRLALDVMNRNRTVLVLVPEIALISQMEGRFRARFGEKVAILHSGLSAGERYDQWRRILTGETPVVVGARSAIFAPLENIGLIIVDEEHDPSYKQGKDLLYNARDLSLVRASQLNCLVLLGSATPSVQSCYNVRMKKIREVRLTRRVEKRPLPAIEIVDQRKQRDVRGVRRFLTPPLEKALNTVLENKEQAILFLNRRGFASLPVCGDCGQAIRCRHCDITLTYHRMDTAYRCHYCGFTIPADTACPSCSSRFIKHLGMGTEKVEAAVKTLFPSARVARMDRDTTSRKGSILKILKGLNSRAIDVLVGTQMVAKGHDFPHVTLVGVICADISLNFPDFRAGERTFQLLAQVAGRAGRGDRPGRVILQTYIPDHFSILAAREQDYEAFYQTEIGYRRALNYPPFTRMIQVRISGKDQEKTRETAESLGNRFRDRCRSLSGERCRMEVLGPIEASITRIADQFRWQILIKAERAGPLHELMRQVQAESPSLFHPAGIRVTADVDPVFMT